jgi:zinc protease
MNDNLENPVSLPSIPPGVSLTTLDHGLTVIVREDHSAPVVSSQAWCMAGSIHEGRWLGAGLSHLLEHMLFKGTTTREGSRIDQEVQEAGGYMNAYTSFDRTVYHIDTPDTGSRVAVDILADIMQNASLPGDEMTKEKQVILREMDMNVDDPNRRSSRRLFETAYTRSPYRFTVIGYPDIFNEVTPQDLRAYYQEKYAPNNVFFVVTGHVNTSEVLDQIRSAYGKAKSRAIAAVALPAEPRQTASREIIEEGPFELGHLHMAWHIPELRHPDVPLLDVLTVLLGAGWSSRLYQQVREKLALVHSVDAWTYSPGNPGMFGMSATFDADKFTSARDALVAELHKLHSILIPEQELTKAVKQFVSATLATRKTMQGQAQDLGSNWLAANDLNFSARYLDAVQRATPADLQRVARQYLLSSNQTLYALLPTGTTPAKTISTAAVHDHAITKIELPNRMRLLVKEDHRLPFVEFRAVLGGGVLVENPGNNGVGFLAARSLVKGTHTRSAEAIATEIESLGGSLDSYGGNNSFGVSAETMNTDFDTGLNLLADVLLNPAFAPAAIEREREVQLAALRAQKDQLLSSALRTACRGLFGEQGYGLNMLGNENSLTKLQPGDLSNWHQRFVTPENCVLAIYGNVQLDRVKSAVEALFGSWKTGASTMPPAATIAASAGNKRIEETHDKKQAVVVVGYPGVTFQNPDRYALELLQEACSDLGSRLFLRVREKLGLAYYVGAQNFVGPAPGYLAFYAGTAPEQAARVEEELLAEAELLRKDGLSLEELERAKAKIIGNKKISRQDLGVYATGTALDELYGLGYAHTEAEDALIRAVTPDQVQSVAAKYLAPGSAVIAVLKP